MSQPSAPIIVDLGKQRSKAIKAFKRGEGELMLEVQRAIAQVRPADATNGSGREIVPVVIVYEEKPARRRIGLLR